MVDKLTLNAGKLQDELSFYNVTATRDDAGGFGTSTKTLAFTTLAYIVPDGSRRTFEANKNEYIESYKVELRYENGKVPNENQLVLFNSIWFNIVSVENVMARNLVIKLILVKK